MKRNFILIVSLFLIVLSTKSFSQVTVTGPTLGCGSTTGTLTAHLSGDVPTDAGITADDVYSPLIPIGFTFNFYGTNYTQITIGANGTIDFNVADAGAYDPWPISAALLGNSSKYNNICGPWCDIDIFYTGTPVGTETYSTDGVAPYRKFAVTWCGCSMFSCGTQKITSQIILYETTNIVEVHIAKKLICAGWNGGYAIVGVQNATGTAATVAPGRDYPSTWTVPPTEAWRFTPLGGGTSYAVSSILYAPIPYSSSLIYWYDSTTGAYLGTGTTLTVTPTTSTTYKAGALGCADTSFGYFHVDVGGVIPSINAFPDVTTTRPSIGNNPSVCGACDGSIVLHRITPGLADTLYYKKNGVWQPTVSTTAAVDSSITISGLCAGVYDSFMIKVGHCISLPVGPHTLVDPAFVATVSNTNPSVCGACDATITLFGLVPGTIDTVNFLKAGVAQPTVIQTVSPGGTITLTGLCAAAYTGITVKMNNCTTAPLSATIVDPPFVITSTSFTNPNCAACIGTITLYGLTPGQTITLNYNRNGVAQAPFVTTSSSTGTITLTNLCDGRYDNFVATLNTCTANWATPVVLVVPPTIVINVLSTTNPSQCGMCDGSIKIVGVTPGIVDSVFYTYNGVPVGVRVISPIDSTVTIFGLCAGNYTNIFIKILNCPTTRIPGPITLTTVPVVAGFTDAIHVGCKGDSVFFTNTTTPSIPLWYRWTFGDGTSDSATNPVHIYTATGTVNTYTVTLISTNHYCDSLSTTTVTLGHPLKSIFNPDTNLVCQGTPVNFINNSIGNPPTYVWNFGNGASSTLTTPTFTYNNVGTYKVALVATDLIPCHDTSYQTITVDTISPISIGITDTAICSGTYITMTGYYSNIGNNGITWTLGNGDIFKNINPLMYAYGGTGTFIINANATFRVCPSASATRTIRVYQQPIISLGNDTTICPGSEALPISDKTNYGNAGATWLWNTGAKTSGIYVTEPGIYHVTVSIDGCTASDSIIVKNDCYMNVPNVFTPNGDGINDFFYPRQYLSSGLTSFKMDIFNRWGELIFESTSLDGRGWDGRLNDVDQPEGVYIYLIDGTFKDGRHEHHQGNITLLR